MAKKTGGSFLAELPRAMLRPLPVVTAIATAAAGVFGAALVAISLGVVWLASTWVVAGRRARESAAPDISQLPPSIQADLLGVTTALDQLVDAMRAAPDEQQPMFEGIRGEAEEIRASVLDLGIKAGALHRHLEATVPTEGAEEPNPQRRERLLARLASYRETLHSLETTASELADRTLDLAAGAPMGYDELDELSPERKISEMKASMAAIEEVMQSETETL